MNKIEEFSYYGWLDDAVRAQKKKGGYHTEANRDARSADILYVAEKIAKKYPKIVDDLLAGKIDGTNRYNYSHKEIMDFLAKTEKGTSVAWKDRKGNQFLFVNAGKGRRLGKKKILIFNDSLLEGGTDAIRQRVAMEILRRDVEQAYIRLAEQERAKMSSRRDFFITQKKQPEHSASSFEKNFKSMVRELGAGASPTGAAKVLIDNMDGGERKKLKQSLPSLGIKSNADFRQVLARWAEEALAEPAQTRKRPRIKIQRGQNMALGM